MKFRLIIVLLVFILSKEAGSQTQVNNLAFDSILFNWNKPNVPGVAVAVLQNENLIYQRAYGMANLKNGIPIDSSTEFWIASVTKQFTAAGIYLLASENKIKLTQPVGKYIPELPLVFKDVTIDQLVHHTSGIRDGFVLTALSKKQEEEYTNANVLKYLKLQKELSFKPGTAFEYNNSGYVLLAIVIERISKQSYPDFMKTNIFAPLGMHQTYVTGKYQAKEKMAEGYRSKDNSNSAGTFKEGHFRGNTYGSTGIITTLYDLGKWTSAILNPGKTKKLQTVVPELLKTAKLSNGTRISYAGGLEKFNYIGNIVFEHFGSDEGFKANILYFPGKNLSIIGLTNNATNYQLTEALYAIAAITLESKTPGKLPPSIPEIPLWEQSYFSLTKYPVYRHVKMYPGYAKISETPGGHELYYYSKNDIFQTADPIPLLSLLITKKEIRIMDRYNRQDNTLVAIDSSMIPERLDMLVGKYFSEELETSYEIISKQGQLLLEFAPGIQFPLRRLTRHDFIFDYVGANHIHFTIDGFEFSREGVRRLSFKKV